MSNPLPCPACGGSAEHASAEVYETGEAYPTRHERYVECGNWRCNVGGPRASTESEALRGWNRLAAAPELADALADLIALKDMKAGITTTAGIEEYERRKPAAWDAARAALAKARGES